MDGMIMNLATSTIDTFLIYYSIQTLAKEKPRIIYIIPAVATVILLNTFSNIVFGLANAIATLIVLFLTSLIYSLILKKGPLYIFSLTLITAVLIFAIEIIFINIIVIVFGLSPADLLSVNLYKILAIIITKSLFFIIIRYGLSKINVQRAFDRKAIVPITVVLLFNMIITFMTFLLFKNIEITSLIDYISLIGMAAGTITFSWVVIMIMRRIIAQNEKELIWTMREKEYQNQRVYFSSLEEIVNTMKAQRHDFNNHISIIYGMIHLGKNKEAEKYIKELGESVSELNDIVQVNHPVITALVNVKKQKSSSEGITMDLDIELPQELSFDYIDLSIILGNLLDNAIEAGKEADEKEIDVRLYTKGNYMIINIVNTKSQVNIYQENDGSNRFTSKKDSDNHGFGLLNVKQVVYRYKGIIRIEDKGDLFEVNIALPLGDDGY
ncbi:GHKL domain-containing protein [Alkaliphilus pronyensis]|uniref:GHKL domain-containing protein n=1 Tax=Alkaliphilus pronyensis TaxID=1482732 RepID=A0A6I0EYV2_9FIRM|nr:GHKL domain-containing protein [Alkaliphilus pronyensis]KAB3534130.1 GHKL domain-containing protein [Alkaliphilus pronyensis]